MRVLDQGNNQYLIGENWKLILEKEEKGIVKPASNEEVHMTWKINGEEIAFSLDIHVPMPSIVKMRLQPLEGNYQNCIPGILYGTNHVESVEPNEFPVLSNRENDCFASDEWSFRADRSTHSVSILWNRNEAAGIWIEPYIMQGEEVIRTGVFTSLRHGMGVSVGYQNSPVTFLDKRNPKPFKGQEVTKCSVQGKVYLIQGMEERGVHRILKSCYKQMHETPQFSKSPKEAVQALIETFLKVNYQEKYHNYSNLYMNWKAGKLEAWRPLVEIGWTGGGVLAFPFLKAQLCMKRDETMWNGAKGWREIIQEIVDGYHEKSGFFHDITETWDARWPDSLENGWWAGFGLAKDCHCAYTNGSALYFILKTMKCLDKNGISYDSSWENACRKVLDTVCVLQREDGNFGYTYNNQKREVIDWDGFAGCWFAAALCYGYERYREERYLQAAKKGAEFYHKFVIALDCYGTPMDTWKAVDEEGNLAFIRQPDCFMKLQKKRNIWNGSDVVWIMSVCGNMDFAQNRNFHLWIIRNFAAAVVASHRFPIPTFIPWR